MARVPPEGRTPEALAKQHYLLPLAAGAGASLPFLGAPGDARAADVGAGPIPQLHARLPTQGRDAPAAIPPGFTGFTPPTPPTGGPTDMLASHGVRTFFQGGPAPMQPTLQEYQRGAEDEPGQTRRPNVLPFTRDAQTGDLMLAMPRALDILGNALPSVAGKALVPVAKGGTTARADRAMLDPAGIFGAERPVSGGDSLASRNPMLYDPIPRPARPFEADYPARRWPDGPPADAFGRLTHDIDGRPLDPGARIVGRSILGGADEALPPAELDAIAAAALGAGPQSVARRSVPRGGAGAYTRGPGVDGIERRIFVDASLAPAARDRVVAHEFGHGVDDVAGEFAGLASHTPYAIPQDGLARELGALYNEINNPMLRAVVDRPGGDLAKALAQGVNRRNFTPVPVESFGSRIPVRHRERSDPAARVPGSLRSR